MLCRFEHRAYRTEAGSDSEKGEAQAMVNRRVFLQSAAAAALGTSALGLLGARRTIPWAELARRLRGKLVLPGDRWYAAYAQPNNLRYDAILPQAIAVCSDARDVSTSILFAREYGVPLVARSGGHSYAGYSTTPGLMIDLRTMNNVAFDESTGIATLGGGARNSNVYSAFRNRNLAITHGRCPSVGVAGLVLGGGIGFNMRAHGLTCDHLIATEIVTADGTTRAVHGNDELFWACRGAGGGNFGINTSFAFQTYEVGPLTVFDLTWKRQPERVFERLIGVLDRAPATLGSKVSAIAPDATTPDITIQLLGQYSGTPAQLREMLAPVYAIAEPEGIVKHDSYWAAQDVLAEPGRPAYWQERSRFFNAPFDHNANAVVFEWLRRYPRTAKSAAFKVFQTGAHVNDRGPHEMAFAHRFSSWLSSIELYWTQTTPPDALARNLAWLDAFYEAIVPLAKGGAYQNFIDPSLRDWQLAYHDGNFQRLRKIKTKYDPTNVFHFAEGIPPG
ncbi:MAG TPA: FAD-binding oxidoreductase [Candidatus Baltobacteraceae bacterium]|nr:FAD-binding oxidoreductase [Candidatus Baltobacteraceae bacterium]